MPTPSSALVWGGPASVYSRETTFPPALSRLLCDQTLRVSQFCELMLAPKSPFPGSPSTAIRPVTLRRPDAKHIASPCSSHAFSSLHVLITGRPEPSSASAQIPPPRR